MDRESLQIAKNYHDLRERHFNGGYFSDHVRSQHNTYLELPEKTQKEFYQDLFNSTFSLAKDVLDSEAVNAKKEEYGTEYWTLSKNFEVDGLGHFTLDLSSTSETDMDEGPYLIIFLENDTFQPRPELSAPTWVPNDPSDSLGLGDGSYQRKSLEEYPHGWELHVDARLDGSVYKNDESGADKVLCLLDYHETLSAIAEVLAVERSSQTT
jgi:hypothetical protein